VASVPNQPTTVPTLQLLYTTSKSINVDYAALIELENGGSSILSYELSLYNKTTQQWVSITGGVN
jgi:hypothetical protein